MKYLNIIFIAVLLAITTNLSAQNDAISKYFDKYLEDERFTVVYISPKMFQLFDKLDLDLNMEDAEEKAMMDMVGDLRGLRILTSEVNSHELFKEAISTIDKREYETLMTVRNKDKENVQFLIKDEGDIINELLLLVDGVDDFVMLSFMGNLDMNKISRLIAAFDDKEEDNNNKEKEEEGKEHPRP